MIYAPEHELLFDGDHLKLAQFTPPNWHPNNQLIVRLQYRDLKRAGFGAPQTIETLYQLGHQILDIQTAENDWFINAETPALELALAQVAKTRPGAVIFGFSMGGYGAFRFARALRAAKVVAVSPQVSLDPAQVPFETRYTEEAKHFDPTLGDLRPFSDAALPGVIFVDPFVRPDLRHAQLLEQLYPSVRILRMPGAGHPATRVLGEARRMGQIIRALPGPVEELRKAQQTHRTIRKESPRYWQIFRAHRGRRFPGLINWAEKAGRMD